MKLLRVHQITWNVASTYPSKDELYESLFLTNSKLEYKFGQFPDIFVINLQEQAVGVLSLIENQWESKFKEFFKVLKQIKKLNFCKFKTNSILFTYQYVFVRVDYLTLFKSLETLYFSDYGGLLGKGTIAFKFKLNNQSIVLLSAHLDAHDFNNENRINHYNRVIKDDRFYDFTRILTSSFAFYAGDLNFRLINRETSELINEINENGKSEKFIENLLSDDQLKIAQQNKRAFHHFEENKIKFRPTFKYHQNTRDYNPKRNPSFCDRILYRSKDKTKIECIYYDSNEDYLQSDHHPVIAVFNLSIDLPSKKPLSTPNAIILSPNKTEVDSKLDVWVNKKSHLDEFGVFKAMISKNDLIDNDQRKRASWDWIGLFKEDFDDLDEYLAYLYVEDVPFNAGLNLPPEEILKKMCNIEKGEEAFELEKATELKEDDQILNEPSVSGLSGESSKQTFVKDDTYLNELKNKFEWTKVEFSEQTFSQPGRYVLIYFNGDRSIEHISEPFEVVAD